MPPPVLPAHAPMAMSRSVGIQYMGPQATKSNLPAAKPVLETMVDTWNRAERKVSSTP